MYHINSEVKRNNSLLSALTETIFFLSTLLHLFLTNEMLFLYLRFWTLFRSSRCIHFRAGVSSLRFQIASCRFWSAWSGPLNLSVLVFFSIYHAVYKLWDSRPRTVKRIQNSVLIHFVRLVLDDALALSKLSFTLNFIWNRVTTESCSFGTQKHKGCFCWQVQRDFGPDLLTDE